ncbi:MAG TPA: VWA domain-containing protein [Candidatus Sulfotelmatobacter sp.]|nr:VWA domain-containing protein [Candidatus Sulfotelmatobacter sp.]
MSAVSRVLLFANLAPAFLFLTSVFAFSQTSLNDVHITPRASVGSTTVSTVTIGRSARVLRSDATLVLVPVSVTDDLNRLVSGLHQENFQVFEGKQAQQIRHFSSEDEPVSVGFVVDVSGSMKDKMDRVQEAVHQFCEIANLQDEFFMITFSEEPRLVQDFTNSPSDIEQQMLFAHSQGRTSLLDAIYMGLEKMRDAKYARKALLIISDGGDNHSRYGSREVKAAVKESDVMIYSIGIFDRYVPTQEELMGPELLSDISEPTGGHAFTLSNPVDMPQVAHHIGVELRTQYVLAYRPQEAPKDGKWHRISVKLQLPKKLAFLRVRARRGYYAIASAVEHH